MRTSLNLDGTWDFCVDLDPKYHDDPHVAGIHPYSQPGLDRRHWQRVPVPGVWQCYAERLDIYEGVGWFVREFECGELPTPARARLHFEAVAYACVVYLNGTRLGAHEGAMTAFSIDASAAVLGGRNHLAVRVDNRALLIVWPPCLGYFNYAGIHRSVHVEIASGPAIDEIAVEAVPIAQGGLIRLRGRITEAVADCRLELVCGEASTVLEIAVDGVVSGVMTVPVALAWSPAAPHLHLLKIILRGNSGEYDSRQLDIGFRRIELHDSRVVLNGEPLQINGVCHVFDSPVTGLVMDTERIAEDVALITQLGANAVRCHYPMDEQFYTACDRAGVLVWIEPQVYCLHPPDDAIATPFSDPIWIALAEQSIIEMVRVARNHPCVAIYGIGNECNTANPEAEIFFRSLAQRVRAEDPTRLLSYAALYGIVGPVADMVDILGINSYWGWYDKIHGGKGLSPEERRAAGTIGCEPIDLTPLVTMLNQVLVEHPHLTLFLTEFGGDSVPGFRSASRDLWSEDYHADLLREILTIADGYPQIAGTFPFCLADYRDPSKAYNGYWNGTNLKGLVTWERRPRLAYAAVRDMYEARAAKHAHLSI